MGTRMLSANSAGSSGRSYRRGAAPAMEQHGLASDNHVGQLGRSQCRPQVLKQVFEHNEALLRTRCRLRCPREDSSEGTRRASWLPRGARSRFADCARGPACVAPELVRTHRAVDCDESNSISYATRLLTAPVVPDDVLGITSDRWRMIPASTRNVIVPQAGKSGTDSVFCSTN